MTYFENKNYLIAGASSGMGEVIARRLHQLGANVILVARSKERLKLIVDELQDRADYFVYDLYDVHNIKDIFTFCKDKSYKLDGMVYTAGVCDMMPVRINNIVRALEIMNLNCMSFLEMSKYFSSRRYSNNASSIVGISSYEAFLCDKGQSIYAGSKNTMESFAKVMAKEFVDREIRVNTIEPAIVDTPMLHRNQESGNYSYEEIRKIQALGVIDPMQIAYLAEFLLSDRSSFITGTSIPVSAGWIGEN